jgi:hypothetical protein
MVVVSSEGEPAREDQGARRNLAGGDVQVGVDRRGWNGDNLRRRRWSSTTAAVFWRGGSPAVDRRWGNSSRGSRRFSQATCRELGRPEERVPMAIRDCGEGGAHRRDGCSAQGRRWRGWRAARDHGEALGGVVVDRERLWWSAHGE